MLLKISILGFLKILYVEFVSHLWFFTFKKIPPIVINPTFALYLSHPPNSYPTIFLKIPPFVFYPTFWQHWLNFVNKGFYWSKLFNRVRFSALDKCRWPVQAILATGRASFDDLIVYSIARYFWSFEAGSRLFWVNYINFHEKLPGNTDFSQQNKQ